MPAANDPLINQMSESVKIVLDLTSRIDERVKILGSQQESLETSIDSVKSKISEAMTRVTLLESKDFQSLKKDTEILAQKVAVLESKNLDEVEKRVQVLEVKLEGVGVGQKTIEDRIKSVIDIVWKIAVPIIGALILWKLGMKP